MNDIQYEQKWSWTLGNFMALSIGLYIATVFVFSSNVQLNIISQIAFIFMCGCSVLYLMLVKKTWYVNKAAVWLFCVLLLAFFSLSWAMDVSFGLKRFITLVQLVALCLFANNMIDTPCKINFVANSVIFSGYFMYLYMFATAGFQGMINMFSDDERLGDVVNQENTFGYYSAMVFAFALYQVVYKRKKWYIIFLPLPVIMGLLSGSKKSLLLLIVIAFMVIALKEKNKIVVRTVLAVAVVALAGFVLYRSGMMDLVLGRVEDAFSGTDDSTNNRWQFIRFGLEKIKEKPFLGYGIEHYSILYEQEFRGAHPSHNNYIQILTSFGIIGFLLWYGAYMYFLTVGIKNFYKDDMAPILVFLTIITLINDFTTTTLLNKFTYILIALCFGIVSVIKKNKNKKITGIRE